MNADLLPLLVAAPLALGALAVASPWAWLRRLLYVLVPAGTLGAGVGLLAHHLHHPAAATHAGSYVPGLAIPFVSDALTALMLTATGLVTCAATAYALLVGEDRRNRYVPGLAIVLTAGVNGALLTGDLFNLFVFIEVMLMPSYALVAITGTWRRLGVGRLFVLVNLLTSTFLLVGVGLVYATAGTVNLAALAGRGGDDGRVAIATGLVLLALSVKAGVVPVHTWLPRAYPATSPAIMALFAGLHTKVAVYAIYRIYTVVFDGGAGAPGSWAIIALCAVTMLVGAFASMGEKTVRAVLAYQMVSGIGFVLVVLAFGAVTGEAAAAASAGLFYLLHHMVTMTALILASGAMEDTYGSGRLDRLDGLARREPWTGAVFGIAALSLVGFPPLSGFLAKVGLVIAAGRGGGAEAWVAIVAVVVASVVALMAMQRVWRLVFWDAPMRRYRPDLRAAWQRLPDDVRIRPVLLAPPTAMLATSIAMVLAAYWVTGWTGAAAEALVDVPSYVAAVMR